MPHMQAYQTVQVQRQSRFINVCYTNDACACLYVNAFAWKLIISVTVYDYVVWVCEQKVLQVHITPLCHH